MADLRASFTHTACTLLVFLNIIVSPAFAQSTSPATTPRPGPGYTLQCITCSSYIGNSPNPACTESTVEISESVTIEECEGPCTTSQDVTDPSVVSRGCITAYHLDPFDVAPEGCYTYQGSTVCVCYLGFCNMDPIGKSSGSPLLVNTSVSTTLAATNAGPVSSSTLTTTTRSTRIDTTATTPSTAIASSSQSSSTTTSTFTPTATTTLPPTTTTTSTLPTTTTSATVRTTSRDTSTNHPGVSSGEPLPANQSVSTSMPQFDTSSLKNETTTSRMITTVTTLAAMTDTNATVSGYTLNCVSCTNYFGNSLNRECSESRVTFGFTVEVVQCRGPCTIRRDPQDPKVITRGCVTWYDLDPYVITSREGCYDWQGNTMCVCFTSFCNTAAIGNSSGEPFLNNEPIPTTTASTIIKFETTSEISTTDSLGQQKSVWCIKCSSYRGDNPGCVKGQIPYIPSNFRNCSAPCFYTLSEPADSSTMTRGCSSDQPDLPIILPPKGCYSWRGALVCVCFTPYCNMEEIEPTYQLSLDYLQPSSSSQSTSTTLSSTAAPILSTSSETAPVVTTSRVTTNVVPTSPETSPTVPTSTETTSTTAYSSVKTSTASSPVVTLLQSSSASVGSSLPDTSLTTSAAQTSENVTSPTTSITEITTSTTAEKIQTPPTAPASIDTTSGTTPTTPTTTTSAVTTTPVTTQTSSAVTSTTVTTPPTTPKSPTTTTSAVTTTPVTTQTSSAETSTTVTTPPTTTSPPIPTASTSSTVITSRLTTVLTTIRPTRATPPTVGANFSIDCFSCSNYDVNGQLFKACPKDGNVDIAMVYLGNCSGPCFTRNDPRDDKLVVRGCTSTIGILPNPLPATGCYDWDEATYCICYDSSCNMAPIGVSSNVSLDDHLINGDTEIVQEGPLQCYQCVANDSLSSLCPKNGGINPNRVYREPCPGVCFTRSFKDDPNKVARGCTSSQYGMPSPLPRSGCYSWNQETWCICNTTNCNRYAIGNSSGVEFDAHLDDIPFVVATANVTLPAYTTTGTTKPPVANATEINNGTFRNDFRCGETAIEVFIPAYLVPNSQLTLRDESCKLVNNGTHHVISTPYNQCGTSEIFYSQQILITNEIKVRSTLKYVDSSPVKFVTDYTMPLNCFPGGNQTVSSVIQILAQEKFQEGVLPNAHFEMRQYRSANYQEQITTYPVKVPLNREIYFELALTNARPNTYSTIQVSQCQATPSNNTNDKTKYLLVSNGCPASPAVQILPRPSPDLFRFSSQAFYFSNATDFIYVHCYVSTCSSGQCTLPCGQSGRVRRSLRGRLQSDLVTLTSSSFQVVTE